MGATYSDIMDAVVEASKDGQSIEEVVLTDESFDTFLTDNEFSERTEREIEETLGDTWTLNVAKGETDHLVTESGTEIQL